MRNNKLRNHSYSLILFYSLFILKGEIHGTVCTAQLHRRITIYFMFKYEINGLLTLHTHTHVITRPLLSQTAPLPEVSESYLYYTGLLFIFPLAQCAHTFHLIPH